MSCFINNSLFSPYSWSLLFFYCFFICMSDSYKEKKQGSSKESLPWCKSNDPRGTQIRGDMQNGFSICYVDQRRKTCGSQHGRLQNCCLQRWHSSSDKWHIPTINENTLVSQTLCRYIMLKIYFLLWECLFTLARMKPMLNASKNIHTHSLFHCL